MTRDPTGRLKLKFDKQQQTFTHLICELLIQCLYDGIVHSHVELPRWDLHRVFHLTQDIHRGKARETASGRIDILIKANI